jgi:hypothetical protein
MPTRDQQDWIMDPSDSNCFLNAQLSEETAEIMTEYGRYFQRLEDNKTLTMTNIANILAKYHKGPVK